MNKELLLHIIETDPRQEFKPEHIFNILLNFGLTKVHTLILHDNGLVITHNGLVICDLSKGEKYLDLALNNVQSVSQTVILKYQNPSQRHLLTVIRKLNNRGKIVTNVEEKYGITRVTFSNFRND